MQHTVSTIYRKLRLNAQIHPPEILMVLKDIIDRLEKLEEEAASEKTRTEKPKPNRRKSSDLSKGEVSPNSLQDRSE